MMLPRLSLFLSVFGLIGVALTSCDHPDLDKYYTPEAAQSFPRSDTVVLVDGGTDAEAVYAARYRSRDYVRIGRIGFVSPYADDTPLLDYGKTLGADVVIVSRRSIQSTIIDAPHGPLGEYSDVPSRNEYGGNEPLFNPAFMPGNMDEPNTPSSYIVRQYRQQAIFLRHAPG
jgi:hypothetical protein